MLADLIREFCAQPDNPYEVYENYTVQAENPLGKETITTIGILVKEDQNTFECLEQLTRFLEAKEFDNADFELEHTSIGELGADAIIYFPWIRDYHPL